MWWKILPWAAVFFMSGGYFMQVWKIHVHKEVRDLSILYHVFLLIGFVLLFIRALYESSTLFVVKQVSTFIPVMIILFQIFYHRSDRWHDDKDPTCSGCEVELELDWDYCPFCGCKAERNEVPF